MGFEIIHNTLKEKQKLLKKRRYLSVKISLRNVSEVLQQRLIRELVNY